MELPAVRKRTKKSLWVPCHRRIFGVMGDYEIRYRGSRGKQSFALHAECESDIAARQLALSLFEDEFSAFEVWREEICVGKGSRVREAA
jgi:hypothetical protein